MNGSRRRKLEHFYSITNDGQLILDVGVSAEPPKAPPQRNLFLKKYRYEPSTYTGLGVQNLDGMEEKYPGKKFVTYEGGRFPFRENEFDWVFSNAVVEHVGNDEDQLLFLNEMHRVAKNVYFTTPNKYFPVESHTNIILLHWNNRIFYRYLKRRGFGQNKGNLYLFSRSRLKALLSKSNIENYKIQNNRLFGIPMTFTVICHK